MSFNAHIKAVQLVAPPDIVGRSDTGRGRVVRGLARTIKPKQQATRLRRSYDATKARGVELHVFCDASEQAYATVAYWRTPKEDGSYTIKLIAAKAKVVAPRRTQTIPRLELQAAVIGARLADTIKREHRYEIERTVYWTDSSTVVHWVRNDTKHYTPFVAHRLEREAYEEDDVDVLHINEQPSIYDWLPDPARFSKYETPRLIAFNESFVPLSSSKEKPFAAVWHEAVCDRKQEDIITAPAIQAAPKPSAKVHSSELVSPNEFLANVIYIRDYVKNLNLNPDEVNLVADKLRNAKSRDEAMITVLTHWELINKINTTP
ncbi:unnamed protein product [Colias eurytheme]|nr:unnamed protein product [Colias eurytheme]